MADTNSTSPTIRRKKLIKEKQDSIKNKGQIRSLGIGFEAKADFERRKKNQEEGTTSPRQEKRFSPSGEHITEEQAERIKPFTKAAQDAAKGTEQIAQDRAAEAEAKEANKPGFFKTIAEKAKGVFGNIQEGILARAERGSVFDRPLFSEPFTGRGIGTVESGVFSETGEELPGKSITLGQGLELGALATAAISVGPQISRYLRQISKPQFSGQVTTLSRGGTVSYGDASFQAIRNPKGIELVTNYVKELVKFTVAPKTVGGILIASTLMGTWSRGENIDGLGFLWKGAKQENDQESLAKLSPIIEDLTEQSVIENVAAAAGPKGFFDNVIVDKLRNLKLRFEADTKKAENLEKSRARGVNV